MVKKVPHISPSAFDYFTGHPQCLCEVVCSCEVYLYLFGVVFVCLFVFRHKKSWHPQECSRAGVEYLELFGEK